VEDEQGQQLVVVNPAFSGKQQVGITTMCTVFVQHPISFHSVSRIRDFLVLSESGSGSGSGSWDPYLWLTDPDADPALFVSDLQDAKKKNYAHSFLKVHLHHSSKIKSHKEVTNQLKSRAFLIYLLVMEESVSGTNKLRIRMRIHNA
jgi:hypothetical protein